MRNDFETGYLEHSALGSTWKKGTKYLRKVKKNGKWVYEYKITGKGYKREYADNRFKSSASQVNARNSSKGVAKKGYSKEKEYSAQKDAERYGRKAAEAESNYYTKSLAGKIESGKKTISKLLDSLKTTETVTITSNLYPAGTKKVIKKK